MTEYEKFKSKKIKTVGQLIDILSKYPTETKLRSTDADCGGYDTSTKDFLVLTDDADYISFGHFEYSIYEAHRQNKISYTEFEELNEELDEECLCGKSTKRHCLNYCNK